jgi:hypothetical protein
MPDAGSSQAVRDALAAHAEWLTIHYREGQPCVLPSTVALDLLITLRRAVAVEA